MFIVLNKYFTAQPVERNIIIINLIILKIDFVTSYWKNTWRSLDFSPINQNPEYFQYFAFIHILSPGELIDEFDHFVDLFTNKYTLKYFIRHVLIKLGVLLKLLQILVDVTKWPESTVCIEIVEETREIDIMKLRVVTERLNLILWNTREDW